MELREFLKRFNASASDIAALSGEEAIKAVEKDGYALKYVKEQTHEICIKAVEENGLALKYVKDQTPEICIKAVEENGDALQYVKESAFDVVNTINVIGV